MRKLLLKKLAFQSTHKNSKTNTHKRTKTVIFNKENNNNFNQTSEINKNNKDINKIKVRNNEI